MNLYTKLWLKLAPKGWRGIEKAKLAKLKDDFRTCEESRDRLYDENTKLKRDNCYLRVIVHDLCSMRDNLRKLHTAKEAPDA